MSIDSLCYICKKDGYLHLLKIDEYRCVLCGVCFGEVKKKFKEIIEKMKNMRKIKQQKRSE